MTEAWANIKQIVCLHGNREELLKLYFEKLRQRDKDFHCYFFVNVCFKAKQ